MLVVFLVSGITGLMHAGTSSPVLAKVLGEYVWMWHAGLIIGAVTSLTGIIFLKPLNDVLVERVGMIWMASCFLAYGVAVCVQDDAVFSTYTGVILGLGIAFAARAWQITSDLRRLTKTLQELPKDVV